MWAALIGAPPTTSTPFAAALQQLRPDSTQLLDLPTTQIAPVTIADYAAAESLVRDIVAFPSGAVPGDRLQVRILDRTGEVNLEDIAATLASRGIEVLEIGNTAVFDDGPTQVVAPAGLFDPDGTPNPGPPATQLDALLEALQTNTVIDEEASSETIVTLLIGADFELASLY